ncbi:hypothetical protein PCE1_002174 [Barthelona sp. PCE]
MSTLFRAPRNFNLVQNDYKVGPGSYNVDVKSTRKFGHAPFGNRADRKLGNEVDLVTPGPGDYGNSKNPLPYKKIPNSSFASSSKRFSHTKSEVPGPGFYPSVSSIKTFKRQPKRAKPIAKPKRKKKHAPSIPHKDSCGYVLSENGKIKPAKNVEIRHSGLKNDTPAPGEYRSEDYNAIGKDTKKTGCFWRSRAPRFMPIKTNTSENVGPGYYDGEETRKDMEKIRNKTLYSQTRQSSVFASKTPSHNIFSVKDSTPAPTDYIPTGVSKPSGLCGTFGSTSSRFVDQKDSVPGPGSYLAVKRDKEAQQDLYNGKVAVRAAKKAAFGNTDRRFRSSRSLAPAPGAYNLTVKDISTEVEKKNISHKYVPFGEEVSRGFNFSTDTPGPGTYEEQPSAITVFRKSQGNSVFRSSVPRFKKKRPSSSPGFKYNPKSPGQKSFLKKRRPFNCQTARDKVSIFSERNLKNNGPPPGSYDPKPTKDIETIRFRPKNANFGRDKRFKKDYSSNPSVGQYDLGSTFIKPTFNVTIDRKALDIVR